MSDHGEQCSECGGTSISEIWYDDEEGFTTNRPDWAEGTCPGQGGSSGDSPAMCDDCGYEGTLGEFWGAAEMAASEEEEEEDEDEVGDEEDDEEG